MAGIFAKGTGLYVGDGASPEAFTKVANVKSIDGPSYKVQVVKTTTHSTVGNFEEKAAVLIDAGQLKFTANFDPDDPTLNPTTAGSLFSSMQALEAVNFQLRLSPGNPNHQMMTGRGFIVDHGFKFPVDNIQEATIAIEIDGALTWTTFTP